MTLTVNGNPVLLDSPVSLTDYLEQNQYRIAQIAIERNGEILPKSRYAETLLKEGDVIEIVTFMGGG